MQLEFELGEFDQGEVYLERLLDAMRLIPPGPSLEYMLLALGIPLAARVSGTARHIVDAEAAADTFLSAPNSSTLLGWGVRAGPGFLAVQKRGCRCRRGTLRFSRIQPGDSARASIGF